MESGQLRRQPAMSRFFEFAGQRRVEPDDLHGQLAQLVVRGPLIKLAGARMAALGGELRFGEDHGCLVWFGLDCRVCRIQASAGAGVGGGVCWRICNSPLAIMARKRSAIS